jgi:hypothetical protein
MPEEDEMIVVLANLDQAPNNARSADTLAKLITINLAS